MYTPDQLKLPEKLELTQVVESVNALLKASPELRDSGEISERTVHYYVQQKLLPKRQGRGPGSTYPASFVYRLVFIRLLQGRGMSLDDIRGTFLRDAMEQISDDAIKSILLGEQLDIRDASEFTSSEIAARVRDGEQVIVAQSHVMASRADGASNSQVPRNERSPMQYSSKVASSESLFVKPAILGSTTECEFCRVDHALIVREGEWCFAIQDSFPVSQGHMLIVPRRHIRSLFGTQEEERSAMFSMLELVRADLDAAFKPDGYNIGINEGRAAGQTIMHMHLHVIPRYAGDKPDPRGGIRWLFPDKAAYWE